MATNWAISQRGLKPATKIVLWHLADCHNPSQGCFPSQEYLVDCCEMSRSSLNDHLRILEDRSLIRRVQRTDPATKQQMSTQYLLAFEEAFSRTQDVVDPCPESGHGAVSEKQLEPCPKNEDSRVRNSDTNPVREPVIEPGRAQERAREGDFDILWSRWPEGQRPDNRKHAEGLFRRLSSDERSQALSAFESYSTAMIRRGKPRRMVTYLKERLFIDFVDAPEVDEDGRFRITPKRPEWGAWLGVIRKKYGDDAVQRTVMRGFYLPETRWPPGHSASA